MFGISKLGISLDWFVTGEGPMLSAENTPIAVSGTSGGYTIPLLTRDDALAFNPRTAIGDPKAHTGDYPEMMGIPVPLWLKEYSTDLRAVRVHNNNMSPTLEKGDIAVIQATGYEGFGFYLFRLEGSLDWGQKNRETKKTSEIPDEAELIGRVLAVVKRVDILGLPSISGNSKSSLEAHEPHPEFGRRMAQLPLILGAAAGEPRETVFLDDVYEIPENKLKRPSREYVAARVKGTSMVNAGIPDGSVAIIRRDRDLQNGSIFLVRYEGEYTLKRYRKDADGTERLDYDDGSGRSVVVHPGEWEAVGAFCFVA